MNFSICKISIPIFLGPHDTRVLAIILELGGGIQVPQVVMDSVVLLPCLIGINAC